MEKTYIRITDWMLCQHFEMLIRITVHTCDFSHELTV